MKRIKTIKKAKFSIVKGGYFLLGEAITLLILVILAVISFNPDSVKSADIELKPTASIPQAIVASPSPSSTTEPSPSPSLQEEKPINHGRSIRIPILPYHYIGESSAQADQVRFNLLLRGTQFSLQREYLSKEGYHPIDLDTMLAGLSGAAILPTKPIVITFDDGYSDLYSSAFPILKKYNFKAVAFIPTGLVDTPNYATWDELSKMHSSGLISLQAHSVRHANLAAVSPEILVNELTESKKTLEGKFGLPVNFVAYPYGSSNQVVWEAVKKAGYLGALGTWSSLIVTEGTIFNIPRVRISGGTNLATFISKL